MALLRSKRRLTRPGAGVLGTGVLRLAPLVASMRLGTVELDATVAAEDDASPKWQQVAKSGEYLGYGGGAQPFSFSREVFEQIVANFRRNPAYKAGADGVGCAAVVPWDISHASEFPAYLGDVAVNGAPAAGWVLELEVRDDEAGNSSLWALTRWLEPVRTFIKEEKYKWASVAVALDGVDARTGESLGPVLTSIAVTNNPFIEGMLELAASKQTAGKPGKGRRRAPAPGRDPARVVGLDGLRKVAAGYWYDRATNAEEALGRFRDLFQLPVIAPVAEIVAMLQKLQGMVSGTVATDETIELDEIIGAVKQIMGLGVLHTGAEAVTQAIAYIQALPVGSEPATPALASPENGSVGASNNPTRIGTKGNPTMDLLNILAAKLGVTANPEAVVSAVEASASFRSHVATALSNPTANDTNLVAALQRRIKAQTEAEDLLMAIATALGVENPAEAVMKITDLVKKAAQLEEVLPQIAELKTKVEETEAATTEQDVGVAASAHYAGVAFDRIAPALRLEYKHLGRVEFLKKYPPPTPADPTQAHLTQDLSGGGAAPRQVVASGAGGTAPVAGAAPGHVAGAGERPKRKPNAIDVALCDGKTLTLKTMAHIRAQPGGERIAYNVLWARACEMVDKGMVFDSIADERRNDAAA